MSEARRALITGITGQDGGHLAELLHAKGYEVFGVIRGQRNARKEALEAEFPWVRIIEADLTDQTSLINARDGRPAARDLQPRRDQPRRLLLPQPAS